MKTSIATIHFYLKTSKTLSDGSHPIMLRVCFHGFKDISSHYSCTLKYWDKKNECIKKGYPNYLASNIELNKLKSRIIARRDDYIHKGIDYTPSMLLSSDEPKKGISKVVSELIVHYCQEKELRNSTCISWKYSSSLIEQFSKGCIVSDIDEGWCKRYAKWMQDRGMKEGSIRTRLGHIACIYRYGAKKGLCDMRVYPFKDWVYTQKFKLSERIEYIDLRSVDVIKEYFLSQVIKMNGMNTFSYINEGYVDYRNPLFVVYFWLLGYCLQGLSPIDICLLKKSDFNLKEINGEYYYSIDTSRMKTNKGVKIRIKVNTIYTQVMISRMLMERGGWEVPILRDTVDDEWFLPILHGLKGDDIDKCKSRVKSIFSYWLNPNLSSVWVDVNRLITKKNYECGLNIPLIDVNCTYYSYRHSFAQMYLQKGGNVLALATLLGRSINSISVYVKQLNEEKDLADAISIID